MSFDFDKVTASKKAYRAKLAALPIAEKLRMLDVMRERAVLVLIKNAAFVRNLKKSGTQGDSNPGGRKRKSDGRR